MTKKRDVIHFKKDLSPENLKKHYHFGFSTKEIEDLFSKYNKNHDGKMTIEEFVKVILPPDFVIED